MIDNHIQYIELQSVDFEATKKFYAEAFEWTFTDWGDEYISFENAGTDGGFSKVDETSGGGALVILFHHDLEKALENVTKAGAVISKNIFSFPGGRRFHFLDPSGNELAIWSTSQVEA